MILHVGPHKTGTSSVQKTLARSREILAGNDITFYTDHVFNANNHYIFHHAFTPCLASHFHAPWFKKLSVLSQADMRKEIRRTLKSCDTSNVVVSSEDLSILPSEGLTSLHHFLRDECGVDVITVVGMLRDPVQYLQSSIQQYVKPGLTDIDDILHNKYSNYALQSRPDFAGGAANILLQIYLPCVERFIDEFGKENCHFLPFDESVRFGLAKSVLKFTGKQAETIKIRELKSNSSISREAATLIAVYNKLHVRYNGAEPLGERNLELVDALKRINGSKAVFPVSMTDAEIDAINDKIRQVNTVLGREAFKPVTRAQICPEDGPALDRFSWASISDIVGVLDAAFASRRELADLNSRYKTILLTLLTNPDVCRYAIKMGLELEVSDFTDEAAAKKG